ncbi:MAG: hypothetical protein CMJ18_24585 [Phycisphaeraceae bacterium]|nr:hypothetical protein [Phycisphaeraceae bacterium]
MLHAPVGRARHFVSGFIALFLLLQLLVPLRYYLGGETDERFCWRMFSSVVQRDCRVAVDETVQERSQSLVRAVPVSSLLPTWSEFLHQHPVVVRRFLHWRCAQADVQAVRYRCRCTRVDGSVAPSVELAVHCGAPR